MAAGRDPARCIVLSSTQGAGSYGKSFPAGTGADR
jgi:hypothetical protein